MSDYKVTIKVQNNNILKLIESRGYVSALHFSKATGYSYSAISKLINMREAPVGKTGALRPAVYHLAEVLNCIPEELFSEAQMEAAMESNKRTLQVGEAEMQFMLNHTLEPTLLEDQLHFQRLPSKIESLLETLTPREAKVISLRYGVNGSDASTLDEVAEVFDVTRERIRQIEIKALRKLRQPHRRETIEDYIE